MCHLRVERHSKSLKCVKVDGIPVGYKLPGTSSTDKVLIPCSLSSGWKRLCYRAMSGDGIQDGGGVFIPPHPSAGASEMMK